MPPRKRPRASSTKTKAPPPPPATSDSPSISEDQRARESTIQIHSQKFILKNQVNSSSTPTPGESLPSSNPGLLASLAAQEADLYDNDDASADKAAGKAGSASEANIKDGEKEPESSERTSQPLSSTDTPSQDVSTSTVPPTMIDLTTSEQSAPFDISQEYLVNYTFDLRPEYCITTPEPPETVPQDYNLTFAGELRQRRKAAGRGDGGYGVLAGEGMMEQLDGMGQVVEEKIPGVSWWNCWGEMMGLVCDRKVQNAANIFDPSAAISYLVPRPPPPLSPPSITIPHDHEGTGAKGKEEGVAMGLGKGNGRRMEENQEWVEQWIQEEKGQGKGQLKGNGRYEHLSKEKHKETEEEAENEQDNEQEKQKDKNNKKERPRRRRKGKHQVSEIVNERDKDTEKDTERNTENLNKHEHENANTTENAKNTATKPDKETEKPLAVKIAIGVVGGRAELVKK